MRSSIDRQFPVRAFGEPSDRLWYRENVREPLWFCGSCGGDLSELSFVRGDGLCAVCCEEDNFVEHSTRLREDT